MIQLRQLSKDFGGRRLLKQVDWHIRSQDRIGLCGENGAGKTSLLKILAGRLEHDGGELQVARGATLGYLPQDGLSHAGSPLFEEVRSALSDLNDMERELRELEGRLGSEQSDEMLERYSDLQHQFELRGGYRMESEVGKVLDGLGFSAADRSKPCEQFSGGWQMRIALAKLLLCKPTLLLLDEPTNHLDLPARNWLEEYLSSYPFAVVLVSHDRFFLDQVVTRIVEIWNGRIEEYPGNYSRYLDERERRILALRDAKKTQDDEVEKLEAFISRFRYQANKASLVQSRIKQLEKVERIEVPPQRKAIVFRFPDPPRGGQTPLELKEVGQRYDDHQVLDQVDLRIEKAERIALVGPNGAGKSTLMRLLAGTESPVGGQRCEGHNLALAYFAQDQAKELNGVKTVLQEITDCAPFEMVPRVRDILGSFLFSGDDVHKKISVLSGGERNRLALAILLLRPANLLLLDEPTNHLDLKSKEVLLDSLKHYKGTLVFVSHDRYFVDEVATRIIEVGGGGIDSFLGNYEDFLRSKQAAGDQGHSNQRVETLEQSPTVVASDDQKNGRLRSYESRKEDKKMRRKLEKDVAELEAALHERESRLSELETQMADPDFYQQSEKFMAANGLHQSMQQEIGDLYERWEALAEKLGQLDTGE